MTRKHVGLALLLISAVLAAAPALQSQTANALKEISFQKDGSRLNVLLKVEGTYTVEASFLPAPPRLVIDLTPVTQLQVLPYTQIDDIGVLDIRTGQFKPETARVVFDLSQTVPAYSVTQLSEGLRISFWYEGEVPPVQAPVRDTGLPQPRTTTAVPQTASAYMAPGRSGMFFSARAGASVSLGAELTRQKEFDLYGETGTINEDYSFGMSPMFEIQFGKYFGKIKAGFAAAYWLIEQRASFTAEMPHPFLMDAYRSVEFEAKDMASNSLLFSFFALFPLMETDKLTLYAGPSLGMAMGKIQSMEDFNFTEKSPFAAEDVTIEEKTYIDDDFTELLFGGMLSLDYKMNNNIFLVFDLRVWYVNPKSVSLGKRANLLSIAPVVGVQFNF